MATMVVKNASGGDEIVEKPNGNGRLAAAASRPVALSTEDLAALAAIVTKLGDVTLSTATLAALETIELGATTLAALENISATVAGVATAANQATAIAAIATIGTRAYGTPVARKAVGAATSQTAAIAATEIMLHASTRCFVASGADPAATTDSIPLEAGEKFTMRITSGHKIAVIRDTADGFLNIIPVA